MMTPHTSLRMPDSGGFALIISLILMGFLLLLMVALSTLVQTELGTVSVQKEREAARRNALLGLRVALGELQRAAGADQRVTAQSFINEKGIVSLEDSTYAQPLWTQVWSTQPRSGSNPETESGEETSASIWPITLVSGNSPDAKTGPAESRAITLVGKGTLGPVLANDKRVVSVEKVSIADSLNQSGSYAWWVGDEGVKASIGTGGVTSSRPWLSPSRFGIEATDAELKKLYEKRPTDGRVYADEMLSKEHSKMVNAGARAVVDSGFHDYALQVNMLLTDVVNGGFRKNLTAALLSAGTADETEFQKLLGDPANTGGRQMFPPQLTGSATTNPQEPDPGGPYWSQLASFFQTRVSDSDTASIAARPQTDETVGLYPVLQMAQLYGYAALVPSSSDAGRGYIRYMVMPVVTLWNPYNVKVKLDGGRVDLMTASNGNSPVFHARWSENGVLKTAYFDPGSTVQESDSQYQGRGQAAWRAFMKLAFRLPDVELEPGETKIFSVGENQILNNTSGNHLVEGLKQGYGIYRDWSMNWAGETVPLYGTDAGGNAAGATELAVSFYRQPQDAIWSLWGDGHGDYTTEAPAGNKLQEVLGRYAFMLGVASTTHGSGGRIWEADSNGELKYSWSEHYIPAQILSNSAPVSGGSDFPAFGFKTALHIPDSSVVPTHPTSSINTSIWQQFKWLVHSNPRAHRIWGAEQVNHTQNNPGWQNVTAPTIFLKNLSDVSLHYQMVHDHEDGGAYTGYSDTQGVYRMVLFDLPREGVPIYSLGEFSQAPLTVPVIEEWRPMRSSNESSAVTSWFTRTYSWSPAYAVGNSWADLRIPPNAAHYQYLTTGTTEGVKVAYDLSWLLNKALWDHYFLSGKEAAGNSWGRIRPWNDEASAVDARLDTYEDSAPLLRLAGGFNVNSTSVKAWQAFLASTWNAQLPGETTSSDTAPLLRHWHPRGADAGEGGGGAMNAASNVGYRRLGEDEIHDLAEAVVLEVKKRGPFLSVADFVNRTLHPSDSDLHLSGALQHAIDGTSINSNLMDPQLDTSALTETLKTQLGNPDAFSGSVLAGIPGYLTQADLLSRLGASLSVRSDTFTIRAYGETVHPLTGAVESQAWLEAVVQRMPERITGNVQDSGTGDEADLGRRFQILSIRWLNENEV